MSAARGPLTCSSRFSRMASRSMRSPSCGKDSGSLAAQAETRPSAGKMGQDGAVLLSRRTIRSVFSPGSGALCIEGPAPPSDLPGARPPPDHGQGVQHASPGGPDWPCPAPGQRWKPRRRRRPQCMPLPVPPPPRGVGLLVPTLPRQLLPELCRHPARGGRPWALSALLLDLIAGSSLPWLSHGLPPSTLDRPGPPRSRP